jgi:hypothetical protein
MLTGKQYEAIGKLALSFNEIEAVIDDFCAHLIGAAEWSVSVLIAQEQKEFSRKADRLKRIVKAIAGERPVLHPNAGAIANLLIKAKALADKRNEHVHALVVVDFRTNETRIKIRGDETACDEARIINWAIEASNLAKSLADECAELLGMLTEIRVLK